MSIKRILSLSLSVAIALGMATTAFAASGNVIFEMFPTNKATEKKANSTTSVVGLVKNEGVRGVDKSTLKEMLPGYNMNETKTVDNSGSVSLIYPTKTEDNTVVSLIRPEDKIRDSETFGLIGNSSRDYRSAKDSVMYTLLP